MFLKKIFHLLAIIVILSSNSVFAADNFKNLIIVYHPLISDKLVKIRDKNTAFHEFREHVTDIAMLLSYEVTKDLPTKIVTIETPVADAKGAVISKEQVLVPILRAGLGFTDGFLRMLPEARVGHIGMYRDEKTKKPVQYLFKMPEIEDQLFIVLDPMVATGNSAVAAVQKLIDAGVPEKNIVFAALIVAPEGMRVFQQAFPNIKVYTAALDEKLNEKAYIVPGLGDAGDRLYGTK